MRLKIPDDVVFRDLAGEAVLLQLTTGIYFGLDPVGTRVWHLLTEYQSPDLIVPLLLQEFDVAEHQLRVDVDDLVTQLLVHRLLLAANDHA